MISNSKGKSRRLVNLETYSSADVRIILVNHGASEAMIAKMFELHSRNVAPAPKNYLSPEKIKNIMVLLNCGMDETITEMTRIGASIVFSGIMHDPIYPWTWVTNNLSAKYLQRDGVLPAIMAKPLLKHLNNSGLLILPQNGKGTLRTSTGIVKLLGYRILEAAQSPEYFVDIVSGKNVIFEIDKTPCDHRLYWFGAETTGHLFGGHINLTLDMAKKLFAPSYGDFVGTTSNTSRARVEEIESRQCFTLLLDLLVNGKNIPPKGFGPLQARMLSI